jgi:hypothetical protein
MEAHFGRFGGCVNLGAKIGARFVPNVPWHGNLFGHNRLNSYVTGVKWKLVSASLEILLI